MPDTLPQPPASSSPESVREFVIRRAVLADAATLGALSSQTFLDTFVHGFGIPYPPEDIDPFIARYHSAEAYAAKLADPEQALWIAQADDGAPVGYAVAGRCGLPVTGADPQHGELHRLYVTEAAKGSGLAARLMTTVLIWLRASERPVWLGVWSENLRAQRFYARWGFEKIAEFDYPVGQTIDREFAMRRASGAI